jgi:hypothetical protein
VDQAVGRLGPGLGALALRQGGPVGASIWSGSVGSGGGGGVEAAASRRCGGGS